MDPLEVVLKRQVSYFADLDGLCGFIHSLGDSPWVELFEFIRDAFTEDDPRTPFYMWGDVDKDFRNLICAMTNFDPDRRITAHEALAHHWFEKV